MTSPKRLRLNSKRDTELLRSELFSIEQLKRHAIVLAGQHKINPRAGADKLLSRLKDNTRVISAAYEVITKANAHYDSSVQRPVPAEAWLLDNYYLIEQQIILARRHLPRGYSKQLPRLIGGNSDGFPRIYDLALALISHMDGRVDSENATQFIVAYQTVHPLMLGELWAFPTMLQMALLENLRRVAVRIAKKREERDIAITWADRMLVIAEKEPNQLIQLLAELAKADIPLTASFVEEFYSRLQHQSTAMAFVQTWVDQQLLLQGVTATKLLESASLTAAANQISIANSIGTLRFIERMNWNNWVESLSAVEQILRQDPVNMYAAQDFTTRDRYRHAVEDIARVATKSKLSVNPHAFAGHCLHTELEVANAAVSLAQAAYANKQAQGLNEANRSEHVGYYLVDDGVLLLEDMMGCHNPWILRCKRICKPYHLLLYLGPILVFTCGITALILLLLGDILNDTWFKNWQFWFFGVVSIVASSALAVSLTNLIVTQLLQPKKLARLDFSHGVPDIHRTMVIVPTLISQLTEIDRLLEALEIRYLGNRDHNLMFALLTDFRDAVEQTMPEDADLISYARAGVEALNIKYQADRPCIFYLFHRQREWNPVDKIWMGYERKRGKLEQFNSLLRETELIANSHRFFADIVGDTSILNTIKYIITLDTDTQLPRDSARALIGNMAHPLNRPVFDANKGRIVSGYVILQPRVSITLTSATLSWFTKLYAGETGIDPYTREVSDVYQDVFGEGSFIGKGIYDVDAFRLAVDGRFPNNLILSHDLLESGYARSSLVTDVDLIEEQPASYAIDVSRRHRWIRGDWQLAAWLLPTVPSMDGLSETRTKNPLSNLSIWKIFDNLRRSLVPLALCVLLLGSWILEPAVPNVWALQIIVLSIIFLPAALSAMIDLVKKPKDRDWLAHIVLTNKTANRTVFLGVLSLLFLPYEAAISIDAIMRSAIRMLFTKRGLLQWHLPSYEIRNASKTCTDFCKEMWIAPLISIVLVLFFIIEHLFQTDRSQSDQLFLWLFSAPILLLWLLSPIVAWWISKPLLIKAPDLTAQQHEFLQICARRTWRYYAQFVAIEDNWLPPDNVQFYPATTIAPRTSPTNIGMGLLANLAAYDFGYITAGELLRLTDNTLTTMEKLERYHGHFYNWYDTRSLQILRPMYISSVDSGNLAGSLLTLQAGLEELKNQPVIADKTLQGLNDTLRLVAEFVPDLPAKGFENKIKFLQENLLEKNLTSSSTMLLSATHLLVEIRQCAKNLMDALPADIDKLGELYYWTHALEQQSQAVLDELHLLMPATSAVSTINDAGIPTLAELARSQSEDYLFIKPDITAVLQRMRDIDHLIERTSALAVMDFEFLYDTSTDLLSIGYDVGERRRDLSCYDLLASEARLASFILIAQGQLPQKHWFSLGRLLTSVGGEISLISWSGSMFEYLMPRLLMPSFENTLLDETCKAVVKRQIKYGQQHNIPWGISESCYNATDIAQVYQYRAFGVPGLGFKRGLGDDLVIAPYATALALMVTPNEACKNLQSLAEHGFLGQYGFYEAIDYTPTRLPRGKNHATVFTYMAHHQGMSLLAFAHVLLHKPMQRRFMSAPHLKATELLLQERVPKQGATLHPHATEVNVESINHEQATGAMMRVFTNPNTLMPEVHLLSNGRYHLMLTNAGGGYSRWHDLAISRWREDASADNWGTFIYLRDVDSLRYWSNAHQPTLRKADYYEAVFSQARAEYRRRDQAIETHTEISVSPEDDVEIRRVTLTNLSNRNRNIEITSYAEVVLAPLNADLAHRAFSNLFVQTEILHDRQAIICSRRPRTASEHVPWMFHIMAAPGVNADQLSFETDRVKFIGRGRSAANPIVFDSEITELNSAGNLLGLVSAQISGQLFGKQARKIAKSSDLSNTDGSVLDPIVAIRRTIHLDPDQSAVIQIISGVANSREAALALIDKYCDRHFVERAFEMAWFQSQEVLRMINASEADAQVYGRLASSVVFSSALRRVAASVIARNLIGQSGLWRFGISGDLPIVLIHIGDLNRLDFFKQVLQAHTYWRMNGLISDLVIIIEDFSGYRADLHDQIIGLIHAGPESQSIDKPGGIFIKRVEDLTEEARVLLQTVARVVLTDDSELLLERVDRRVSVERISDRLEPILAVNNDAQVIQAERTLIFQNGIGGFTADGHEYVIRLRQGQTTPAPWVNVIASPHIGTVVSESGSAYTWVENAHEFRLTSWHNDPVTDISGEAHYIRDEETGAFWSPTPLPACALAQIPTSYICRHGFGYSIFEHNEAGISSEMISYVAMDAPVKFVVIKLRNFSKRTRQLSLTGYWELVLGEWRHHNMMHIVTEQDPQTGALFARNSFGRESANRLVFAHVSEKENTVSGNRTEFIGRNGSLASPAAMRLKRLSGKTGAGLDPCAAIQTKLTLFENQEREFVFVFGAVKNADEARHCIRQMGGPAGARQALDAVHEYWNHTLGAVQVETPDPALDVLANGWLIYQTISCRLWARSGYYQSGGAYGFRDQLQDTMALIHTSPWLAREQIIRCAGRQFLQGDVQHWWHPPNGQGVRTHFSDDYLWLVYATSRYVAATGDNAILDESIHFLEGRVLDAHEEAYYDVPLRSNEAASLYEHCLRAIKHSDHYGEHQLPLIGSGDWNDGMNLIGKDGKGESVWLAWFLVENLNLFSVIAQLRGEFECAADCKNKADLLTTNIEINAWDGEWYRRAYFDDGTPLGSKTNDECQIDSISQSWAVISQAGNPDRARQAMAALNQRLVQRDAQLIKLLSPPFDKSSLEPGYIKGYVPGVRENGGQYTHAAIWATMAFAMQGDHARAWELFAMLNPINHAITPQQIETYKVEPYVMSADIYATAPHTGRGGWTWYTGAAGWMYRLTIETLLGINLENNQLRIAPCLPAHWQTYKVHYRYRDTVYHITFNCNGKYSGEFEKIIPLVDDRQEHFIQIDLA